MFYLAIDGRTLESSNSNVTRNQQLLFPDLKFMCSGTISSLIVGADIAVGGLSAVPEIQVWRPEEGSSDSYSKVDSIGLSSSLIHDVSVGLAVYRLETTLSFMAGDILGIFYPQQSNLFLPSLPDHGSEVLRKEIEGLQPPDSFVLDKGVVSRSRKEWPLVAVSKGGTFTNILFCNKIFVLGTR